MIILYSSDLVELHTFFNCFRETKKRQRSICWKHDNAQEKVLQKVNLFITKSIFSWILVHIWDVQKLHKNIRKSCAWYVSTVFVKVIKSYVLKIFCFFKTHIFRPQLNELVLYWYLLNLPKAHALCVLDNMGEFSDSKCNAMQNRLLCTPLEARRAKALPISNAGAALVFSLCCYNYYCY